MSGLRHAGAALLAAVVAERGLELLVSAHHARRLRALGGVESGRGHYPVMVAFHAALLAACALEPWALPAPWPAAAAAPAAVAVILAQALRWWAVATLGTRWTTRVITLPGAPPVRRGPYRWLRHPNYLAVAIEVAALPLALGAWRTALVGSALNALLLRERIRVEEMAMGPAWREVFRGRLPPVNVNVPVPVPEVSRERAARPGPAVRDTIGQHGGNHG